MDNLLSQELQEYLYKKGASIVSFGDIKEVTKGENANYVSGISIGVAMTKSIVKGISNGPTLEYYHEYKSINEVLDHIVMAGEEFLVSRGYQAYAQTTSRIEDDEKYRTRYPHKTIATRAGVGWIGKCALLVTNEYGSALRISSILTNAPLPYSEAINTSFCGDCQECVIACPAMAATGSNWSVEKDRDDFFNAYQCRDMARKKAAIIGITATICGKCICSCPHTQNYIT